MGEVSVLKTGFEMLESTPLFHLTKIGKNLNASIAVKAEYLNPTGSMEDRIASDVIDRAQKTGKITPGKSILIGTANGNLAISLAYFGKLRGYQMVFTLPAGTSADAMSILKISGAKVILTDPTKGIEGARKRAEEVREETSESYILNLLQDEIYFDAYYKSMGEEIWRQTRGKVDIICLGVGSEGACAGVARFLLKKNPKVKIYPVETSVTNLPHQPHQISGTGTGEITDLLGCDDALRVHSDEAFAMVKRLAAEESIFCGLSSGANVSAAVELARRPENKNKLIVTTINNYYDEIYTICQNHEIHRPVCPLISNPSGLSDSSQKRNDQSKVVMKFSADSVKCAEIATINEVIEYIDMFMDSSKTWNTVLLESKSQEFERRQLLVEEILSHMSLTKYTEQRLHEIQDSKEKAHSVEKLHRIVNTATKVLPKLCESVIQRTAHNIITKAPPVSKETLVSYLNNGLLTRMDKTHNIEPMDSSSKEQEREAPVVLKWIESQNKKIITSLLRDGVLIKNLLKAKSICLMVSENLASRKNISLEKSRLKFCVFCDGKDHFPSSCPNFKTPLKKSARMAEKGLCLQCWQSNQHNICPKNSVLCSKCQKTHHRLFCSEEKEKASEKKMEKAPKEDESKMETKVAGETSSCDIDDASNPKKQDEVIGEIFESDGKMEEECMEQTDVAVTGNKDHQTTEKGGEPVEGKSETRKRKSVDPMPEQVQPRPSDAIPSNNFRNYTIGRKLWLKTHQGLILMWNLQQDAAFLLKKDLPAILKAVKVDTQEAFFRKLKAMGFHIETSRFEKWRVIRHPQFHGHRHDWLRVLARVPEPPEASDSEEEPGTSSSPKKIRRSERIRKAVRY